MLLITWRGKLGRNVTSLNSGEAIFLNSFTNTYCMTMIRCALESPDLGQPFKYLGHHHNMKKFKSHLKSKSFRKIEESQKFRESQLSLKSKILNFLVISKHSFISTNCTIII